MVYVYSIFKNRFSIVEFLNAQVFILIFINFYQFLYNHEIMSVNKNKKTDFQNWKKRSENGPLYNITRRNLRFKIKEENRQSF